MSIDAWTQTPAYTISGIGPYAITHPYNLGAIFAFVAVGTERITLTPTLFTLVPEASVSLGSLFLTPEAAATYAGKKLTIDRQTPDEQGWQAVIGEREAGLEAQLNRMVMAGQELRAAIAGAVRTRENLEVFDWPDGTVPLRAGTKVIAGPTASQILNAQAFADQARSDAAAAAASAATALAKENSMLRLRGPWTPGMTLKPSDIVGFNGSQYDCVIPHVTVNFATDLAAGRLRLFLAQGAPGAGTGDMLAQNFGTEYSANAAVFRSNVGLAIGREIPQMVAGQIEFFLTGIVPERYLELNGQTVSRTTYNLLFAAIGAICGLGDGSTTFELPDMRGLFPRVNQAGRAIGSIQQDALQEHIHGLNTGGGGVIRILGSQTARVAGLSSDGSVWGEGFTFRGAGGGRHVSPASNPDGTVSGGINPVRTSFETRPRNMALMACVCVGPLPTPPAVLLPPEAIGTINAQFFTQGVAITPINLGAFFSGPPTSITISPSTPGLTIGPAPSFLLSGTPTTGRATTLMTVTASRGAGTATQTFTTLIAVPGSTGRADIENLRYGATPNGRTSTATLKRPGTDALPAGWGTSGNIISINAPFSGDIENWDFTNKQLSVNVPIGDVRQCLFGETVAPGPDFYINVFVGGRISILEYNDFTGPFRDGGAKAAIKQQNNGGTTNRLVGEIPIIRFNRITGLSFDGIKVGGSADAAGQIIEWNYFGAPVNLPQTPALVWSAATTYSKGQFVKDLARNTKTMESLIDGNLNNLVPTNKTSTTIWRVLDPHADAITTESAINKITIRYNLVDWNKDPEGVFGPYINGGLTNGFRLSRNDGQAARVDAVEIDRNVVRWGQVDQPSTPIQVSAGDPVLPNFNGPVSFTNNWLDSDSGGTYFHPSTNGLVNVWSNNRNAGTDALITGPTLRGGGVAPANAGGANAPAVTGGTTAGSTLTCSTGTWTGDPTITFSFQWELDGVAVSGATSNTFAAPVGNVNCDVTATNASGSVSLTSNIATITSAAAITVDSGSLKMPDGNMTATLSNAPAYLADAANWAPTGQEIFTGNTGAFVIMISVPWDQIGMSSSQNMGVFGNTANTGVNSSILGLQVVRGLTDQEPFNLVFRLRDAAGNNLVSTIPVTKAQRRLLCVFRFEGAALQHEVYHNGVRIGVNAPALGTFTGSILRSQLLYGAMGSGSGDAFSAGGSTFGFIGSIAYFGYRNTALTQADCEAMSLGVDPLVQTSAANWRMYRRLIDTSAASLAKPAAASGDATAALILNNSRSLIWRKGSDLLPVRSGATWIDHNPILDGRVFGRIKGNATGRAFLSGRASGVTGLMEARSFDENGAVKQDWTTIIGSTIAAGVFSGYIDAPPNNGFGHFDIRPASNPAMVSRIRARTGVGLVIGVMGQSQNARCWLYPVAGAAGPNIGALSTIDVPTRTATTYGLVSTVVTGERIYTGSLIGVANMLRSYTTEPVMLMNLSNSGQSTFHLQDDSNTAWNWSELEALLTQACGPFAERRVSAVVIDWLTSFANAVGQAGNGIIGNNVRPLFDGTFDAGATPYTVNHFLRDGLTFPESTTYVVSPPSRNTDAALGPVDFSGATSSPKNHGTGRGQWLTFAAGEGFTVGPYTDDLDLASDGGLGGGGPHQNVLRFEGNPRHLIRKAIAGMWGMLVNAKTNPSLGGVVRSGGGAVFTISPNLPNGGTLQTAWGFKGIAVPTGETSVQGFEVQNGGTGAWSRSGFTTSISAGSVVLTKTSGAWIANTKIRYNANGPLDYGTATATLSLFNGALYESGPEESGLGLPLAGLWTATV